MFPRNFVNTSTESRVELLLFKKNLNKPHLHIYIRNSVRKIKNRRSASGADLYGVGSGGCCKIM